MASKDGALKGHRNSRDAFPCPFRAQRVSSFFLGRRSLSRACPRLASEAPSGRRQILNCVAQWGVIREPSPFGSHQDRHRTEWVLARDHHRLCAARRNGPLDGAEFWDSILDFSRRDAKVPATVSSDIQACIDGQIHAVVGSFGNVLRICVCVRHVDLVVRRKWSSNVDNR